MNKTCIIITILLFQFKIVEAQSSVVVNEDSRVTSMMNQYLRINRSITHLSGWRVTVITTTDRRVMEQTKTEFQKNYNLSTKWEYKEPYYHLKAGAFLNRNDALYALESVKKKFSSAFISLDKIAYDEL
ncbi:MAG: hypothetical protein ABIO44_02665 [Saprospiraceae bacterium]